MNKKRLAVLSCICLMIMSVMCYAGSITVKAADDEDYIEIWTPADLDFIRYNLEGNYKLMADIDLSNDTEEGGLLDYYGYGWNPIGKYSENEEEIEAFSGVFDGNGHTISGYKIRNGKVSALFVCNKGVIKNLVISDVNINHYYSRYYAGLVGINYGNIENVSFINSSINGCSANDAKTIGRNNKRYIGSIVGYNISGCIFKCSNSSNLYSITHSTNGATTFMGGICGNSNSGMIKECFNIGDVYNDDNPYGTINNADYMSEGNAEIVDCYSYEYLLPNGALGSDNVSNFYCIDTDDMKVVLYINNGGKITKKIITGEQIKNPSNYEDFNFNKVWVLNTNLEYPFPQLKNNMQNAYKVVEMLDWVTKPNRTVFYNDENIDPTGGKVKAFYTDGTNEVIDVTNDMISGFDNSIIGQQTLTVTLREGIVTYKVSVAERGNVTEIQIISEPDISVFVKGTKLDFSDAIARIFFDDDTYRDVYLTPDNTSGGNINTLGVQTITYSYGGFEASFDIKVIPVQIIGIEVSRFPRVTSYIEGQNADLSGLMVSVLRNNGTKTPTEDYFLSDISNEAGICEVTVTYGTFTTTFDLSFAQKSLLKIEVTNRPDKLNYIEGELFDPTGMEVTAYWDNDTTEVISDYEIGSYNGIGLISIPIAYSDKTTYISIRVTEKQAIGIRISKNPTKTVYSLGSSFNPTGMVVNLMYDSGIEEEISDYTCGDMPNELGTQSITISYGGFDAALEIEITEPQVNSLEITKKPDKTEYIKGEIFDTSGMEITARWDNLTSSIVNDYTISGFDEIEESGNIIISFGGKNTNLSITVHYPKSEWDIINKASCTKKGSKQLACQYCEKILYTEEIDILAHDYEDEVVESTCLNRGYTIHTCKDCGYTTKDTYVDAKGHTYNDEIIEPTCTQRGYTKHTCKDCGNTVKDTYVDATGHFDDDEVIEPTCTQRGYTKHTCRVCKRVTADNYVDALGHTLVLDEAVKPTCEDTGLGEGYHCSVCGVVTRKQEVLSARGHNWISEGSVYPTCTEEGEKEYKCSRCGQSKFEPLKPYGHLERNVSGVAATCTEDGLTDGVICGRCNAIIEEQTVIPALGHSFTNPGIERKWPTCTEDGIKEYKCIRCQELKYETLKAYGHLDEDVLKENPTCTEPGHEAGKKCKRCSLILEGMEEIPALGHDTVVISNTTVNPTCTEDGKEADEMCSRCGLITGSIIKATGHNMETHKAVAITCTEAGNSAYWSCDKCNKFFSDSTGKTEIEEDSWIIPAKGHDYGTLISEEPVTCTKDGVKAHYKCSGCNELFIKEGNEYIKTDNDALIIKSSGHVEEDILAVAATCTEEGNTAGKKCSVCGEVLESPETIPAVGHKWDEGRVTKEPTETDKGVKIYICSVCNETKTEDIPAKGKVAPTPANKPTETPTGKPSEPSSAPDTKPTEVPEVPATSATPTPTPTVEPGKQQEVDGVGTISADGKSLTDTDGDKYLVAEKITSDNLVKNAAIADKGSAGKYKITKVTKKKGKITGGTVTYMKPYNKNSTSAVVRDTVKLGGVKFKVTVIANNAFKGSKIKKLTIGKYITKIGKNAANGCTDLKDIKIKTKVLKKIGSKAFKGINAKAKFKVSAKNKVKKYKKMLKKAGAPKKAKVTK